MNLPEHHREGGVETQMDQSLLLVAKPADCSFPQRLPAPQSFTS